MDVAVGHHFGTLINHGQNHKITTAGIDFLPRTQRFVHHHSGGARYFTNHLVHKLLHLRHHDLSEYGQDDCGAAARRIGGCFHQPQ